MNKKTTKTGGATAAGLAPQPDPIDPQSPKLVDKSLIRRKKRSPLMPVVIIIFLLGMALMLYPSFSNWINSREQSRAIVGYSDNVDALLEETKREQWEAAVEYNKYIYENGQPFEMTDEERIEYNSKLSLDGTGIMGYLDIPDIKVSLPIYHGTGESVLQAGVGHLEGSSLPVGGINTNCVLSGHRGLPSAKLLTDLDRMEPGNRFTVSVLGEKLVYEVFEVIVVTQEESDPLYITDGYDMCTLVTCTPYGINTHRLLVRAKRVNTEGE